jgi:hypothetical protein
LMVFSTHIIYSWSSTMYNIFTLTRLAHKMTYISLYISESKSSWFLEVSNFNISIFSVREILKNSTRVIWQINQTTTGPSFRELRQILTDTFSVSSRHCRVYNLASCNSSTVFFVAYFHCIHQNWIVRSFLR